LKFKRENNKFNLSFLDIMCCGFGAVVLLVMLINGKTLQRRDETRNDLKAELERISIRNAYAGNDLARLKDTLRRMELQEKNINVQIDQLKNLIAIRRSDVSLADQKAHLQEEEIKTMQQRKELLESIKKIREEKNTIKLSGPNLIGFDGEGQRQYLTGLKLGGERTLILLDISASMLDETVVNIVRQKLMSETARRRAPKWTRVISSLHWIIANLRPDKRYQVFCFNTKVRPLIEGTKNRWLNTNDSALLERTVSESGKIAPEGGTNLEKAFEVIEHMVPRPDNVLLLTDGLPTQGASIMLKNTITAEDRQKLFDTAVSTIPAGVPVNTLLFPMEGDPGAAESFWGLAIATNGSFITPSRDWP
jgi:hypothetical protein